MLADSTNQFLQAQLEDARRRLIEHEKKLEEFRRRNAGRLPSQVQSNLQMIQATQSQIQANADGTNRDRDRLQMLEAVHCGDHGSGADRATGESRPRAEGAAPARRSSWQQRGANCAARPRAAPDAAASRRRAAPSA